MTSFWAVYIWHQHREDDEHKEFPTREAAYSWANEYRRKHKKASIEIGHWQQIK